MSPWRARWRAGRAALRRSLRWRLLRLFLVMAIATTVIFIGGVRQVLQGGWQAYAQPIVGDYLDRLAAEIGTPPDPTKAAAIAARLPLTIRIDGPNVQWSSQPERPRHGWRNRDGDDAEDWSGADPFARAPREARFSTRLLADGHRVRFGLARPPAEFASHSAGWVTLGLLLVITGLAYAYVRRLLRPLDDIRAGAARYARGEFEPPIGVRRADELGDLARGIDTMAAELHRMLDAKRALLLAISHELRSPLTRARINAELIDAGPEQQALLRDLGEMRDLVSDLLESERLATGHAALQTEAVDLAALLREVADAANASVPEAARQVCVEIDDAPSAGGTSAYLLPLDRTRIRLLLRNLIDNALRHSADAAAPPVARLTADADGVRLVVRDHGPGVAEAHLPHLAEPFYRADSARRRATGGVGLGLYLCRLVAEAHGGTLVLRNAGPGLEAGVTLPAPA